MPPRLAACAAALAAASWGRRALAEVVSGEVQAEPHGFQYLGKFCFAHEPRQNGTESGMRADISLSLDAGVPRSQRPSGLWVGLYDDECGPRDSVGKGVHERQDCAARTKGFDNVWASVQGRKGAPSLTCTQKKEGGPSDLRFPVTWDGNNEFHATAHVYNSRRDRAFYAVLSGADNNDGADDCRALTTGVSYSIHFTNPSEGWNWSEFGVNEQGMNIMYVVFMFAYLGLVGAQIYSRTIYEHTHHLPKLFSVVLSCQTSATLLFTIHYTSFSFDGVGHPFLKFVAELGVVAAHTMLVLMLTLIAQGWTILRSEVQYRNLLLAMVASLGGFSFLLLWWGAFPASAATEAADGFGAFVWRDPTSFTYLYDTSPGVVLLLLDLGAAGVFLACTAQTVRKAEELQRVGQKNFLLEMGVVFGAYLALMPIVVAIAGVAFDHWAREKWMRTLGMIADLAAHSGMLFLLWPTRAEKHFLLAGNFNKAVSGGFASPFGAGGGLEDSLLEGDDSAYPSGF